MLTIFLLSLIGVPLTGGFFGKFYIFKAALESKLYWLTVLGLLNSAVARALLLLLRILVVMYMKEPSEAAIQRRAALASASARRCLLPAAATLALGIFPNWVLDFAGRSSNLLR